jgi:hypothetical protein
VPRTLIRKVWTMRSIPLFWRALGALVVSSMFIAIGIMAPAGAAVVAHQHNLSDLATTAILPPSADTCSGSVCIYVVGTGLTVSNWTTTAVLSKTMCSTARYLDDGVVIATSGSTCGTSGEQLASDWPSPGSFPNGTQLCNTWSGVSGEPCITVHS